MTATPNLEALWAGPFGDAYTERNREAGANRGVFWHDMWTRTQAHTLLEVGCNVGGNLRWVPGGFGVDLNRSALAAAGDVVPGRLAAASAGALPFANKSFDLAFTCGVLIHIRRDRLMGVMAELARVTRKYVLLMEYAADRDVVVTWRGQWAALWRAPYGRMFRDRFPNFLLLDEGFLPRTDGFDNVTWWLFERRG